MSTNKNKNVDTSIYYFMWLVEPFQPRCMINVTTSDRKRPLHLQQYTRVSNLWCLYLTTDKVRQSLLFVWSIKWSITTLKYSPFTVFEWFSPLCWCVLHNRI